jgi:hypothetical protein
MPWGNDRIPVLDIGAYLAGEASEPVCPEGAYKLIEESLPETFEDGCPRCGSADVTAVGLGIQDGPGAPIKDRRTCETCKQPFFRVRLEVVSSADEWPFDPDGIPL